jgi:hypothetical protein
VQEVYKFGDFFSSKSFHKKTQSSLKSTLKSIFPKYGNCANVTFKLICGCVEVLEEYKHPDLISTSGRNLELDFFYPQFKLAIEFQVTCSFNYCNV